MRKKRRVYYADFETTQPDNNNIVEVYLWCMVSGKDEFKGYNIESYINLISTLKATIYFHNLKFDFSYIQYYLIKNNIKHEVLEKKGQIYSVKVFDCELRDSLNFIPMTLKEVGELYCKNYKKTSIDYNVQRGHKATKEEEDYCILDCRVLEEGLTNYLYTLEETIRNAGCCEDTCKKVYKKLTNSGIAFEVFKEMSDFERLCPKTTINEYNAFKGAYKGGYVYSNNMGIVEDVQMIDNNSMYPHIYSTIELPFGKPIKCKNFKDCEKYKFYIVHVYIKYELKEGYIPIIGGSVGKFTTCNYKASSNGEYEEHTFCNSDLDLIKEFYECDIAYIWGRGFETKPQFFKEYADTFIKVKNASKGIKRSVAKVLLNSPYGKTAMNGLTEIKEYFIDEEDNTIKSNIIGYSVDDGVFQYLPIAIQITAGARHLLLTTAKKIGFENILYMDTDSIKFKYKKVDFEFNSDILGMWKDEGRCELFKTIAPKKYAYYFEDRIYYTCAGFNKSILTNEMKHGQQLTRLEAITLLNRFDSGLQLECLQSKKVNGGRALIPIKKEIK